MERATCTGSMGGFIAMKKIITLTNKECEVLDDMFMYMVDYMEDRCWSGADKRAFDRIYRKLGES